VKLQTRIPIHFKCLYEDVVNLFADDGEVYFSGGVYRGKNEGVRRLYVGGFLQGFTGGKPGPVHGFLLEHLQLQDIVDVAPDGKTAKARFRCFMQAGAHVTSKSPMGEAARKAKREPTQWWEGGIYENAYVKEDGVWKIKLLNYYALWHADYKTGWSYTRENYVPRKPTLPLPESRNRGAADIGIQLEKRNAVASSQNSGVRSQNICCKNEIFLATGNWQLATGNW
jgi:hypothetical protein